VFAAGLTGEVKRPAQIKRVDWSVEQDVLKVKQGIITRSCDYVEIKA
jgi:hypothetical protein